MGPPPVGAQGRNGLPPGLAKKVPATTPNTSTTPTVQQPPATVSRRLQTFGTWLDTAYVNAPGEAWAWVSTTYWRSSLLREIDAPAMGVSVGVAARTQVGVSLPYYHLTDEFGLTWHGFGSSYATLKFVLVQQRRVNASISPTLEILSWSSPPVGRVNAVLPINVQTYWGNARFYGSTGYFTRGSVFGSGAAEWPAGPRATVTTTIAHSYSVVTDLISDATGISRHRTDVSGGLYLSLRPAVVLFGSVGRTVSPVTETSGRLSVTGGLTVNLAGPALHAPRNP